MRKRLVSWLLDDDLRQNISIIGLIWMILLGLLWLELDEATAFVAVVKPLFYLALVAFSYCWGWTGIFIIIFIPFPSVKWVGLLMLAVWLVVEIGREIVWDVLGRR